MTKDLYQNFYIQRKRISMIMSYVVIIASILLIRNEYGIVFSSLIYVPFTLAPTLIQVSSERDLISNYDKVQLTMPVTKKDVITAKYLLGFIYSLFNTGVLLLLFMLQILFVKSITFKVGMYLILASFLLSLVSMSINYLSFIVLGSKGGIIYAGVMAIILIGYFFNPSLINSEIIIDTLLTMKSTTLIGIGFIVPSMLLLLSYLCSVLYFTKKTIS